METKLFSREAVKLCGRYFLLIVWNMLRSTQIRSHPQGGEIGVLGGELVFESLWVIPVCYERK